MLVLFLNSQCLPFICIHRMTKIILLPLGSTLITELSEHTIAVNGSGLIIMSTIMCKIAG